MSETIFYLWYSPQDRRFMRRSYALKCGDCFTALIDDVWVQTRIEHSSESSHSHGWYLVTHPDRALEELPVRKEGL